MKVKDVMVKEVITLRPKETVREATSKFAAHNISGCPVVNEKNEVVGVFSEEDILEALKTQYKELKMLMPPQIMFGISFVEVIKEKEALQAFAEIGDTSIESIMKKDVMTASPEDTLEKVIQLMVKNKVNRIPIVENQKLTGIVTRGDILKGFFREMGKSLP